MSGFIFLIIIIGFLVFGFAVLKVTFMLLGYLLTGLVIGLLARLVVRGTKGMGLINTILTGIVGALGGGLLSDYMGVDGSFIRFLISIATASSLILLNRLIWHKE